MECGAGASLGISYTTTRYIITSASVCLRLVFLDFDLYVSSQSCMLFQFLLRSFSICLLRYVALTAVKASSSSLSLFVSLSLPLSLCLSLFDVAFELEATILTVKARMILAIAGRRAKQTAGLTGAGRGPFEH